MEEMGRRERIAGIAVDASFLFVALAIGGSLFEHLVLDTAWPDNVRLIQPGDGGVDRKVFWIPVHVAITVAMLVAAIASWRDRPVRNRVLIGIALYAAMRIWTGVYFIPEALSFETLPAMTPEAQEAARTWVRWSPVRSLLLLGSGIALWSAVVRRRTRAAAH